MGHCIDAETKYLLLRFINYQYKIINVKVYELVCMVLLHTKTTEPIVMELGVATTSRLLFISIPILHSVIYNTYRKTEPSKNL